MNFIGEGAQRERGDYWLYWVSLSLSHWAAATSMPLSENIEGTTAHFILNSIHCCSRTSFFPLSTSSPLRLPPCWGARQHMPQTFCQSSVAHPTQAELSFLSCCCCCCCCWSCKQIAQFFFGFSSAVSFLFCSLLLLALLAAAACRMPLPGGGYQRIILSKECGGCSSKLLWPKEKQRWLQQARKGVERRRGEGRGNGESEKWKVEKPNEKEREKYLLCSLVGFPVPCLLAPKAII